MVKIAYNVAILGTISSGKSTLLNAIFGKTYSEMKIRRTTMIPSQYNFSENSQSKTKLACIQETNNKLNEKYSGDYIWDGKEVPQFVVPAPKKFIKPYKFMDISIYDVPGLNDQKTKDTYYKWVRDNTQNFDLVYLLYDINSGLNTSDELELLQLVCAMMIQNERLKVFILGNKCDSLVMGKDNTYKMDDEHRDIFEKQMVPTIHIQMKNYNISDDRYHVIPFCSRLNYIYRTLAHLNQKEKEDIIKLLKTTNNFEELNSLGYLNFKHLEEIMINDLGRMKWNKMSNEQKVKRLEKVLAINPDNEADENDEVIQMSGGKHLFELTKYYTNKDQIIPNILFRMFQETNPLENVQLLGILGAIEVSSKKHLNEEYQYIILNNACENISKRLPPDFWTPTNINEWSKLVLDMFDHYKLFKSNIKIEELPIYKQAKQAVKLFKDDLIMYSKNDYTKSQLRIISQKLEPHSSVLELLTGLKIDNQIYNIQLKLYDIYTSFFKSEFNKKDILNTSNKIMCALRGTDLFERSDDGDIEAFSQTIDECVSFGLNYNIDIEVYQKMYDDVIDGKIIGLSSKTFMYETLKLVVELGHTNIDIKARLFCLERKINQEQKQYTINEIKLILSNVYDLDTNNYYRLIMRNLV